MSEQGANEAAAEVAAHIGLSSTEQDLITQRRKAAGIEDRPATQESSPKVHALAFSGGGIRSATFCLGLARALAKNGAFKDFDYLSTVSGGGYIGSAIGRLYSGKAKGETVSAGLAEDRSLFMWWLRRNGRFLLPTGGADVLTASAGYLRGLLATQFEVAVLALLLSCLIVLPHLLMTIFPVLLRPGQLLGTPWWSLLVLMLPAALAASFAFWFSRDAQTATTPTTRSSSGDGVAGALTLALGAAVLAGVYHFGQIGGIEFTRLGIGGALGLALLSVPLGLWWRRLYPDKAVRQLRVQFTQRLGLVIALSLGLGLVGLLDLLSWIAAQYLAQGELRYLASGAGGTAVLVLILRTAVPAAQRLSASPKFGLSLAQLANVAGLALSLLIVGLWLIAVQWLVFFSWQPATAASCVLDGTVCGIRLEDPVWRFVGLSAVLALYALVSGRNLDQLNRASLHPFYRSRLARAYVSVGNSPDADHAVRPPRFTLSPLKGIFGVDANQVKQVVDFVDGDDITLRKYTPHKHGGPIHLVNVCINQTTDARTGTYNADRKGTNLAVSSLGIEYGQGTPEEVDSVLNTELSQWIAISGAALATGMGSITKPGIAALSFLTGLRLGYWWSPDGSPPGRWAKYRATLREWFGLFPPRNHSAPDGSQSAPARNQSALYLSDGGHYDNTGVYALLKRKPELIVVADCGADPQYQFADIENLVRKARIDYRAEIEFIDPGSVPPYPCFELLAGHLGTPDSIGPGAGKQFLLLARITYVDQSKGTLLVVKPRRVTGLSVDVAGYSDRDLEFPQQTTGDQFFDESQWESYCELGRQLGEVLTKSNLELLMTASATGKVAATRSLESEEGAGKNSSRRARLSPLVTQTVGIGAAASLVLGCWQIWRDTSAAAASADKETKSAVSQLLGAAVEDKSKPGLVDRALSGNLDDLQRVIEKLEDFGSVHGAELQDAAAASLARAVLGRCLYVSNGGSSTPMRADSNYCSYALITLDQVRRGWLSNGFWHYQDSQHDAPKTYQVPVCRELLHRRVVIRRSTGTPAEFAWLRSIEDQALTVGLRSDWIEAPAISLFDRQMRRGRSTEGSIPRVPIVLAQPQDLACAAALAQFLTLSASDKTTLKVGHCQLPGFSHAAGELQIALVNVGGTADLLPPKSCETLEAKDPAAQRPPVAGKSVDLKSLGQALIQAAEQSGSEDLSSTSSVPTAEANSSAGKDAAASAAEPSTSPALPKLSNTTRTIYIQFRGNMTREQVNQLRASLSAEGLDVPAAERIGGSYRNLVKYFNDDDTGDAKIIADWIRTKLGDTKLNCSLSQDLDLTKAYSKDRPSHIEVWISPDCK